MMRELGNCTGFSIANDYFFVWSDKQIFKGDLNIVSREEDRQAIFVTALEFQLQPTDENRIENVVSKSQQD